MSDGKKKSNRNRSRNNRNRRKKKRVDPLVFWGDPEAIPRGRQDVATSHEPDALVRSLGRPPLQGQEQAAERFFDAVYRGSVGLATALAAAARLDTEPEPLPEPAPVPELLEDDGEDTDGEDTDGDDDSEGGEATDGGGSDTDSGEDADD